MTDDRARTTRLLLATRFVRSIGQGALAVDLTLYLRTLGWSAEPISSRSRAPRYSRESS